MRCLKSTDLIHMLGRYDTDSANFVEGSAVLEPVKYEYFILFHTFCSILHTYSYSGTAWDSSWDNGHCVVLKKVDIFPGIGCRLFVSS